MRIDKYLKVARVLKKREIGKELASNSRLFVNDKAVKAAYEVKIGDKIKIEFGNRIIKIRVLDIRENASKQDALSMYEVVEEANS